MTRTRSKPCVGDSGFSLVELIVVIAILSVALTAAVPLATSLRHSMALDVAAREVTLGLRAARSAAIYGNKEANFMLDGATGQYWSDVAPVNKRLPAQVVVSSAQRTVGQIRFFPDGGASGGTIVLREARRSAAIEIDALTGRTSVNVSR
jgi:general secretion pathway protein H